MINALGRWHTFAMLFYGESSYVGCVFGLTVAVSRSFKQTNIYFSVPDDNLLLNSIKP